MSEHTVEPFTMRVEEIFYFSDASTVFVGIVTGGKNAITPCDVSVLLDEVVIAKIHLNGERMPGPKLSPEHRVVYTYDHFEIDKSIEKNRYTLICCG
jgi:hypothetical protein